MGALLFLNVIKKLQSRNNIIALCIVIIGNLPPSKGIAFLSGYPMLRKYIIIALCLLPVLKVTAQQFIGLTTHEYTSVQQIPLNPSWVTRARFGAEVNLVSFNVLATNNAYQASGQVMFNAGKKGFEMTEGRDYSKIDNKRNKKAWANVDILGPAASFKYDNDVQLGVYTRFRAIAAGGNITPYQFAVYTDDKHPDYFNHTMTFEKTGAVAHAFGEVGFTYGKMIRNDYYYKVGIGVTVKYLMGYTAINGYFGDMAYQRQGDSINYAKGDATLYYTFNVNPDATNDLGTRAGKGSLGLDIGYHYEYYPDIDPNKKADYKLSFAASITDIGGVAYVGDAGSASYDVRATREKIKQYEIQDVDNKQFRNYLNRLSADTIVKLTDSATKFRIGLPTAFRANLDYNLGSHVFVAVNTLINLKGNNGEVYRPGYASYINITPRYDLKHFKFAMPFTFMRYSNMTMGAIFYTGPLYFGSNTLLSALAGQKVRSIDFYTGLAVKLVRKHREHLTEFDNGYDDPDRGLKSLKKILPRFMRGGDSYEKAKCPPRGRR